MRWTFGIFTALVLGTSLTAQAAPLAVGTMIGIDFGPTVPANNYNQIYIDPGSNDGAYGSFVDFNGVAVDGVGLTITDSNFSNDDGTSQDSYPAFLNVQDQNTTDFIGRGVVPFTLTWTGLDDSLTYNLSGISSFEAFPLSNVWAAGSQSVAVDNQSTTGGTLAQLLGLQTDGAGNLTVTVYSTAGQSAIANSMVLQAVPEPSSAALLTLGVVFLAARRRNRGGCQQ